MRFTARGRKRDEREGRGKEGVMVKGGRLWRVEGCGGWKVVEGGRVRGCGGWEEWRRAEERVQDCSLLQEKDDANFKLMSERIKSNSVQKLLLEEKDLLHSQLVALNTEKQRLVAINILLSTYYANESNKGEGKAYYV